MDNRLTYNFFDQHVATVAHDLIGALLVWNNVTVMITETEGYRGVDDAASHAAKGPTARSCIMFGPAGYTYVYLIYGMHNCLNIVTEPENSPSAVLIRAIKVIETNTLISGPGRVCAFLGITRLDNGINLLTSNTHYVLPRQANLEIISTPRIGITKNKDILWRFLIKK